MRRARRDVRFTLTALRLVSLADALILAAVVYAWLVGRYDVVALLLPSHALLFLLLVLSLSPRPRGAI